MSRFADQATLAAYRLGWAAVRRMPERAAYAAFDGIARVMHRRGGKGVDRLRANYARVRPELGPAELDALVLAGLRSYMRYWCEAFRLPDMTIDELVDRVRLPGIEALRAQLDSGGPGVLFLGHLGNWDMLGAWATTQLAPVTTVAERLEPEELFEEFLSFREALGMTILPLTGGQSAFGQLLRAARDGALIPLLADRDLTTSGIPVTLCGHAASAAAGPAALAVASGAPLFSLGVHYERRPDGRYDVVGTFGGPYDPPEGLARDAQIAALTQRCVDDLSVVIREHTEDWHVMQRVFTDDLPRRRPG